MPRQIAATPQAPQPLQTSQASPDGQAGSDSEKPTTLLGAHGGKLAAGAAAMLGLAIFYKWREHQLAKNDPEEYARLQRLKAVITADKAKHKKKAPPPRDELK